MIKKRTINKKRQREEKFICMTPIKKQKIDENVIVETKANKSDDPKERKIERFIEITPTKFKSKKYKKKQNLFLEDNDFDPYTINELHNLAKKKFLEIQNDSIVDYTIILDEVLSIYDIDETINNFFLQKLKEYYENNKQTIDEDKTGKSDKIANLFFNYIFTLSPEKRKIQYQNYKYFKENEIFTKNDEVFFYYDNLQLVFKTFINELLKISLSIKDNSTKKTSKQYIEELTQLYSKYQFPSFSYKIPIKYGNKELMYIMFIVKLQTIYCVDNKEKDKEIFFKYDIADKFIALNYFKEYFLLKTYDDLAIQYIIFCIYIYFKYNEIQYHLLQNDIKEQFFICSRFVYQSFEEKKKYLKQIQSYIKNEVNIDDIDQNYLNNHLLKINYNNNEVELNGNDCFFLGNKTYYLEEIINKKNYTFEHLKKKKFPLFYDNDNLNNDFKAHMKIILQSKLTLQYIKSLKNIPQLDKTIFTDKIIEEINSNSLWVRFPINNVYAITDREIYTIYLSNNVHCKKDEKFSNNISSKIITNSHEDCNHIARLILSINNFNISKSTPKDEIFKSKKYNNISILYNDQGDMWEHIIFGDKISNLYILGSFFILDTNNYSLNIAEFQKKFKNNNIPGKIDVLNSTLKKLKKNENNKLIKYINEFNLDNCEDRKWLKDNQKIVARNNPINSDNWQCMIRTGICGTH